MTYPEEALLDEAITKAVTTDRPDAIVIGWAVCVAYRTPDLVESGDTAQGYFVPAGQPKYSTIGLLSGVSDWMRGIGGDEQP